MESNMDLINKLNRQHQLNSDEWGELLRCNDEKVAKSSESEAKGQQKDETSAVAEKSVKVADSVEKPPSITPEMLMKSIEKVQREIWYTRIALAIFLIINLVYIKLCISDINDTMSMFLQFLMGAMNSD